MRAIVHQLVFGLAMSAGTVAVCSVPSDGKSAGAAATPAAPAMCRVAWPPAPVDVTTPVAPSPSADGADTSRVQRLRRTETVETPRRDYFDDDWDEDRLESAAPRIPRGTRSRP